MTDNFEAVFTFSAAPPVAPHHRPYILIVGHDASRTGAPIALLRLVEALRTLDRFELRIVLRSGGPLVEEFLRVAPLCDASEYCARHAISNIDFVAMIARTFAALDPPGLAICNTITLSEYNEAFARAGVDLFTWVHELPAYYEASVMEQIVRTSNYIGVYSEWNRAHYSGPYAIPADKLVMLPPVLPHLASRLTAPEERYAARQTIGMPQDALIVLGVGSIHLIKGTDLFIQVAARCSSQLSQSDASRLVFCWIGAEPDFFTGRALLHDIAALGLEGRVVLAGHQPDPWPWFRAADVYACTSRWEALSISTLEAMSSGLPVVTFSEVGASRFVIDQAGSVIHSRDVDGFSREIARYLNVPGLKARAGEVGHKRTRVEFGDRKLSQGLMSILDQLSSNVAR